MSSEASIVYLALAGWREACLLHAPGHAHTGGAPWESMPRAVISAVITS
jgi:hypothetical protein